MKKQAFAIFNPPERSASTRGGVLVIILVAVALFAALSFAMTQGMRGGSGQLTEQQAKLAASELVEYSNQVHQAVKSLLIKGCLDTQISFESAATGIEYHNPNAPLDHSCDVFHSNGGGLKHMEVPPRYTTTNRLWTFYGDSRVTDIGTIENDLMMSAASLKQEICLEMNKMYGIDNPDGIPPVDTHNAPAAFTGSYALVAGQKEIGDQSNLLKNKQAFCRKPTATNTNNIYHRVLIVR